jgi:2'-5' RNA ligase
MPEQTIRTFIALEIGEEIKAEIAQIQDKIKEANCVSGKWVLKDNMHLTLKFIGDTELKTVQKIKEELNRCLKDEKSIKCNVSSVGVFPDDRFARVIWVGIKNGDMQIIDLAEKLENRLCKLGFKKEKKDFKTHITICRPKQILDRNLLKASLEEINGNFKPKEFTADKITFFESKLTPQGPIYSALSSIILQ